MTRKKDTALAQPVNADKWERQRQAERITVQDRKTVPHLNSTMGGRYEGKELSYRGRVRERPRPTPANAPIKTHGSAPGMRRATQSQKPW